MTKEEIITWWNKAIEEKKHVKDVFISLGCETYFLRNEDFNLRLSFCRNVYTIAFASDFRKIEVETVEITESEFWKFKNQL